MRAVFSIWPEACWNLRLNCSFFSLSSSSSSWSAVIALKSLAFMGTLPSLAKSRHEARLDRKFGGGKGERLFGGGPADPVDLEENTARLDAAGPVFGCALAGAHSNFGRLLRNRHVREHSDPYPSGAFHGARQCTPGRL